MSTIFTGPAVNVYVAASLRTGLRLYARTGIKPNRQWTPKNMMTMAARLTGRTFKARDYNGAADALQAWIDAAPKDGISATCR